MQAKLKWKVVLPLRKRIRSKRICEKLSLTSRVGGMPEWTNSKGAIKKISTRLNGAGYTYTSGARTIVTALHAKNERYSASASSTTCADKWTSHHVKLVSQEVQPTSEYADEKREIRTLSSTMVVATFQK